MAAVNHERLKGLFLELVRIDSLSRKEHDVAVRIQREVERAGAICRYDNAGEKVRGVLAGMQADQRRCLEMAFFQGLTHSEIAQQTGDPLGTVKTRIRQGLIQLRKVFQPQ